MAEIVEISGKSITRRRDKDEEGQSEEVTRVAWFVLGHVCKLCRAAAPVIWQGKMRLSPIAVGWCPRGRRPLSLQTSFQLTRRSRPTQSLRLVCSEMVSPRDTTQFSNIP